MYLNNSKIKYFFNRLKVLTVEVVTIIITFLISLFILIFFIRSVFFLKKNAFDNMVFEYLANYVSASHTAFMECFTWLGSQFFLVPAYLILMLYFFFIKKDTWLGIKIASVSVSSLIVLFSLKYLFHRPRPLMPLLKEVQGLSFPSGHAFMSFSFFGLLIYIIHKEIKILWVKLVLITVLISIVFFVGISRIYLRVHYASDVIAGFCMGFMWMVISLTVLHFIEKHKTKLTNILPSLE